MKCSYTGTHCFYCCYYRQQQTDTAPEVAKLQLQLKACSRRAQQAEADLAQLQRDSSNSAQEVTRLTASARKLEARGTQYEWQLRGAELPSDAPAADMLLKLADEAVAAQEALQKGQFPTGTSFQMAPQRTVSSSTANSTTASGGSAKAALVEHTLLCISADAYAKMKATKEAAARRAELELAALEQRAKELEGDLLDERDASEALQTQVTRLKEQLETVEASAAEAAAELIAARAAAAAVAGSDENSGGSRPSAELLSTVRALQQTRVSAVEYYIVCWYM
jgi:septal ring factor EnvC (AmiA/AmiB activator)